MTSEMDPIVVVLNRLPVHFRFGLTSGNAQEIAISLMQHSKLMLLDRAARDPLAPTIAVVPADRSSPNSDKSVCGGFNRPPH